MSRDHTVDPSVTRQRGIGDRGAQSHKRLRLVIFGPPGAGKSTQARLLASHFGIVHIVSGDLLRREVARSTKLGRAVQSCLEHGDLVPDHLMLEVLKPHLLSSLETGGYVLDGFPRTLVQALAIEQMDHVVARSIDAAIYLEITAEEARRRLLGRALAEGRSDDTAEVIEHRLKVFEERTMPLLHHYTSRGLLITVVSRLSIEDVFQDIISRLDQFLSRSMSP
jgi:adenylate kinase